MTNHLQMFRSTSTFALPKGKINRKHRGVVERFIAPVLKTGDPSRGPGVRIPPPLLIQFQYEQKPRILYDFGAFFFFTPTNFIKGISKNLSFSGLNPSPFSGREGYKEFLEMPIVQFSVKEIFRSDLLTMIALLPKP